MSAVVIDLNAHRQRLATGPHCKSAAAAVPVDHEIRMRENLMGLAVVLGLLLSGLAVLNAVRGLDASLRCADLGVIACGQVVR